MSKEIWKPISGYEGLYEVSNKGQIRSIPRLVHYSAGYDRININLLGGVKDRLICDGNRSWQYIYNDNISVLLAPKDGDVGHLPKKYRCADVLVTCGELKNYNLLCCGNVVWTSEKEVPKYYVNAVSTKDSTFDINFK